MHEIKVVLNAAEDCQSANKVRVIEFKNRKHSSTNKLMRSCGVRIEAVFYVHSLWRYKGNYVGFRFSLLRMRLLTIDLANATTNSYVINRQSFIE